MCLILLGYRLNEARELVVAANRDEYFERPSAAASFWCDQNDLFAGRDLEARGTWMGVTRSGRFAALANWTQLSPPHSELRSRGELPTKFLTGSNSAQDFVAQLNGSHYQGFNLLVFDGEELMYFNNRTNERRTLTPGHYALSNTRLGDPWARADRALEFFKSLADTATPAQLISALGDDEAREFEPAAEQPSAPCFIRGTKYGTRASTTLIVSPNRIHFSEQSYEPMGVPSHLVDEAFARVCAP